jgi:outer membrane protein OmpA-like peptidoglycan-associated protein
MESRLGRDFSQVRVHANNPAADAVGAKAFAYGRDIVFGPGQYAPHSPAGSDLLAHELTHIAQQAEQGAPAMQKQPKTEPVGIGSVPPAEAFQKAADPGPEDSSVLFDLDKADLSAASRKALTQAIGTHKGPVTVQIHGYASNEGQGPTMSEYNLNLSAHRAAAIKAFLDGKLPAGSRFVLFAHGESTAFAPLEQNRRAGFTIKDGVETPEDAKKKVEAEAKQEESKDNTSRYGPVVFNPKITPSPYSSSTSPLDPYRPTAPRLTLDPAFAPPTYGDMDWDGFHSKAADHGMRLDDPMAGSLQQHWNFSYHFFLPFLGRDGAISASNLATNYAFSNWLSSENPNAFDRFNKEFQQAYPNENHLILPFGSDALDWVRMKLKGNTKDDYYFRF